MSDYISRHAAIDTFNRAVQDVGILDADDIETVFEMLSSADVVQVVRCDDCVYYGSRRWCELHSSVFDDNAFAVTAKGRSNTCLSKQQ